MEVENDLSQSALLLTVPQAYLEYTSSDWDPPHAGTMVFLG
ncbi:hypothetical protein ACVV37_09370 [Escherichia coli]